MKRRLCLVVVGLCILPPSIPLTAAQEGPGSYYELLQSLMQRRNSSRVRPKPADRDINLIEIDKGAAGVLFGATMDEVVEIWGRPGGFFIERLMPAWQLHIGACQFGFIDNRLVTISIHSATLDTAHFANGIGFQSTYDEVKAAFGQPVESSYSTLRFATEDGYTAEFHFIPKASASGKRELINIEIGHPDGPHSVGSMGAESMIKDLAFRLHLDSSQDSGLITSGTYYERLASLITKRDFLHVRPNASERDVNLIEIAKGAAGVTFGASMDDVVAIWGKPNGLFVDMRPTWDLRIGTCRFGFLDNRLVTVSVGKITLKEAHLPNGIDFGSSYDEVKAAFGNPIEADKRRLEFVTDEGYVVKFHFLKKELLSMGPKLASIEICHPDSGE